jgi:hypothetical protein
MTTIPPQGDDDLMTLVRSADPLDGEDGSAPDEVLLERVLAAPREERRPRILRRPIAVRIAAVAAVAVVAVAAVAELTGDGGGGVTPASAAVLRHARAALAQSPDTILHVDMTGTQTNPDGTTVSWRDESWQQNSAPYDRRQVETQDGTTAESANVGSEEQVYDPSTDTIYGSSATGGANHKPFLTPGPRSGTFVLHPTMFGVRPNGTFKVFPGMRGSVVITAGQARALRKGTARVTWRRSHAAGALNGRRLAVVHKAPAAPSDTSPDPDSSDFRSQILALLRSGGAYLVGHATIDSRDTLEIKSQDGTTSYYVDPTSYAPVELDTTGDGGGVNLRFTTWEELPASDANDALLSLTARHPSATVDHSQADYMAAERRIFPNG